MVVQNEKLMHALLGVAVWMGRGHLMPTRRREGKRKDHDDRLSWYVLKPASLSLARSFGLHLSDCPPLFLLAHVYGFVALPRFSGVPLPTHRAAMTHAYT